MADQLALFIDFENIAIWAQEHFLDLDLDRLMTYLRTRGPVVVKRAYGDWSRFAQYREELLSNSIDLVQLYSVRAGKNRADIRLALDAFEVAISRSQIGTVVIVSGDSDFGPLASKLREYGRYILGIGPRAITHDLLVKSCDEFVYLEAVLGQETALLDASEGGMEKARRLLVEALSRFGQRGDLPVLATKLKDTMLSVDPTFNEANLGYEQFRAWLEDNGDLVNLFFRGLQMYVAPVDFDLPSDEFAAAPRPEATRGPTLGMEAQFDLAGSYRGVFSKVVAVDTDSRRDVLRDIYRELSEQPGEWTLAGLREELKERYDAKGLDRSKRLLLRIMQLGFVQHAYEYLGDVSFNTPVKLAEEIDSQSTFIQRAEAAYLHAVIRAGLRVDEGELAAVLLDDRLQADYIREILDDLVRRGIVERVDDQYRLPGRGENLLGDDPVLDVVVREIQSVELPVDLSRDVATAQQMARRGMAKRTQDFVSSARDYLLACRLLWDAYERRDPEASLDELRWYVASYASVRAGELSQVCKEYTAAQPYYLAFFALVQEHTPLWNRMRGLINPLLHFYWRNLAREMNVGLDYTTSPASVVVEIATHPNPTLRERWREATEKLAGINPDVVERVAGQIRLLEEHADRDSGVAEEIEEMLEEGDPGER